MPTLLEGGFGITQVIIIDFGFYIYIRTRSTFETTGARSCGLGLGYFLIFEGRRFLYMIYRNTYLVFI